MSIFEVVSHKQTLKACDGSGSLVLLTASQVICGGGGRLGQVRYTKLTNGKHYVKL